MIFFLSIGLRQKFDRSLWSVQWFSAWLDVTGRKWAGTVSITCRYVLFRSGTRREINSLSCSIKSKSDYIYHFPMILESNAIPFGSKSNWKWEVQSGFGWFNQNQKSTSVCVCIFFEFGVTLQRQSGQDTWHRLSGTLNTE